MRSNWIRLLFTMVVSTAGVMVPLRTYTYAQAPDSVPLLRLDDAIQIALANNRDLKIASLEVDKSKWQVAAAKTRRLPSFHCYLFGSGNLTSPVFTFKEGSLGTFHNEPLPSQDATIPLSHGVTGYAFAQIAQPITQLYKI